MPPEESVQAIVLRRTESGESDRRLTLLTLERGRVDVVAKGARKSASRLAGSSDPLTESTLFLTTGKRTPFVTQAQTLRSFRKLRQDFDRLSHGLALAEIVAVVSPHDQPVPELYELTLASLGHLEEHAKPSVVSVWAQMKILTEAGFVPQFEVCVVCDKRIEDAAPWVSPHAGGFLSEDCAMPYTDRFRVRAEILYGLSRIVELDAPPPNLKFAAESLATLLAFWRAIAEKPLPAAESLARLETSHEPKLENK